MLVNKAYDGCLYMGKNALILFVLARNRTAIQQMLDCGASINSTDFTERTALHYLAREDETAEFTNWLLSLEKVKKNVNIDAETRGGETPLM